MGSLITWIVIVVLIQVFSAWQKKKKEEEEANSGSPSSDSQETSQQAPSLLEEIKKALEQAQNPTPQPEPTPTPIPTQRNPIDPKNWELPEPEMEDDEEYETEEVQTQTPKKEFEEFVSIHDQMDEPEDMDNILQETSMVQRHSFRNPSQEELQKALLWKEILDKPLALRGPRR